MGNVRLYGSTSGYTELAPPAVAPDGVLSLPSGTGTLATTADVAAGAGGLVHINTTTFSAVSSVSIDNVFTSTYDNYLILYKQTAASVPGNLFGRFRVSATDNSSANYFTQFVGIDSNAVTRNYTEAGADSFFVAPNRDGGNSDLTAVSMVCYNPQIASRTQLTQTIAGCATNNGAPTGQAGGSQFNLTTQFDGLTIYPAGGTITGTLRVYGYRNGA